MLFWPKHDDPSTVIVNGLNSLAASNMYGAATSRPTFV